MTEVSGRAAPWRLLVFGVTGAIGAAAAEAAMERGWTVVGASRAGRRDGTSEGHDIIRYDPFAEDGAGAPEWGDAFDAVCWAQGANAADSVRDVTEASHLELYRANCVFVLLSLRDLLAAGKLSASGARLCVVSSIWQDRARQNKLSYTMTKAAIGGMVRSASVDLAADGHLINAVLPGVIDTPMTRQNLSAEQLDRVQSATPFGRLASLASVAEAIGFFCSSANTGVTGQSVTVDMGFSNAHLL